MVIAWDSVEVNFATRANVCLALKNTWDTAQLIFAQVVSVRLNILAALWEAAVILIAVTASLVQKIIYNVIC